MKSKKIKGDLKILPMPIPTPTPVKFTPLPKIPQIPTATRKTKAAIYIRVSTLKQANEGFGLEEQLKKCKGIVDLRDWEIYDIYCNEKGLSGDTEIKDRKGKELNCLLEDAKKGLFQAVVFNSLDRLGRSTKIVLDVVDKFKELNLKIVSCRENIDTSTASGELVLTFFAGIAQYEKRIIIERMAGGRETVRRKYGEKGGKLPYGYKRGMDKNIDVDPVESSIVRSIFMMRNEGISLGKIASWLNNLNVKTKKGGIWYGSSINVILKNEEKYRGAERNGNENGICWPKILFYNDDEDVKDEEENDEDEEENNEDEEENNEDEEENNEDEEENNEDEEENNEDEEENNEDEEENNEDEG